jgi:hypothetical protein
VRRCHEGEQVAYSDIGTLASTTSSSMLAKVAAIVQALTVVATEPDVPAFIPLI